MFHVKQTEITWQIYISKIIIRPSNEVFINKSVGGGGVNDGVGWEISQEPELLGLSIYIYYISV